MLCHGYSLLKIYSPYAFPSALRCPHPDAIIEISARCHNRCSERDVQPGDVWNTARSASNTQTSDRADPGPTKGQDLSARLLLRGLSVERRAACATLPRRNRLSLRKDDSRRLHLPEVPPGLSSGERLQRPPGGALLQGRGEVDRRRNAQAGTARLPLRAVQDELLDGGRVQGSLQTGKASEVGEVVRRPVWQGRR